MLLGVLILVVTALASCSRPVEPLPILGDPVVINHDTVYPVIPPFSFINQDSIRITESFFKDKIYVANFIFLSCPTICPKMTKEMKLVYDAYSLDTNVLFISHSIDPARDTPQRLKAYANAMDIDIHKWVFVSGNRDSIYTLAERNYFSTAYTDSLAPGGFVHSGGLLLLDKQRHIRGVYDGTNPTQTKRLIKDIETLLGEYKPLTSQAL
jgi:protein SCO1/2